MKSLLCLILLPYIAHATPQLNYREAEALEKRFLFKAAIKKYQQVVKQKDRLWSRRAAFRMTTLIRDIHFSQGRSETLRKQIVSMYKSLLADFPNSKQDPELWAELHKELRWTRLGLQSPKMLFEGLAN